MAKRRRVFIKCYIKERECYIGGERMRRTDEEYILDVAKEYYPESFEEIN
ncbi:hypothetical protein KKH23_08190 [Patescibacteria group bacterium]|uniref:Uncharacterized protein n=1 Tax=viral metagenome TaxID=1070528 RepID=A0A6M3MCS0_9ZZZZ|nr:hypothetical protein [Patescibacteria group bacterium]